MTTRITGITLLLLFLGLLPPLHHAEEGVNDLYDLVDKQTQSLFVEPTLVNHSSRPLVKESSLPINELLEKNVKPGESKLALHPLPKHGDPRQHSQHSQHNKSKKVLKSDRLLEHNGEKTRQLEGLSPKTQVTGAVTANNHHNHNHNHNRTVQRTNQESQSNLGPPQQGEAEGHPNYRARLPSQVLPPPPPPPPPSPRKEPASRRLDPEENRPGKSSLYQPLAASRNNSRPPAVFNQRSSLLYQLDLLRRESDLAHDAFCLSECRKEKDEREYYCYSEFAVNGIVHDIEVVRKGIRLVTLMVSGDAFYKMSRLYVSPDNFFFKVRLLVLDTYKCSKPCPDIKLGTRYIVMGQIYHRRRYLPGDLVNLLGGKLKPGDGLLRSNNYIKRFNKRRHQKALEATHSRCR
ncbi:UPF0450 protein C17orf58 homolog isoform X2 [Nelusetta ayraudi]|uniref:UPF0450 protein C17orf58 homolog isoform X2 n=1 Tax=Nelusetta ayraudi TaxID=303726 RepID=UPI003F6FD762